MPGLFTTGFKEGAAGVDIGDISKGLVEKSYLMDVYPGLNNTFKQAGLWVWGRNSYGGLGINSISERSSPVQTVAGGANWKQVSTDGLTSGGIKTDGTLWMWGYGQNGSLGDNAFTNKSSPVQTVAGGTNWKQVSTGMSTSAIKTDGTLWTWGYNLYGALGDNTTISQRSSPVQTVAGGNNWKQVSSKGNTMGAIKTDGTLWMWGSGGWGELGDGTTVNKSSPVQTVAGGSKWKQVSASYGLTAAIKTDGTLWLWGRNSYGQLGDNTIVNKSSPVQTVAGGSNWKQVSCSYTSTAAIKTDGTLWLWGNNQYGQLGDNTIVIKSSPVQTVAGGSNWKQVSSGGITTGAIKTDGTLWLWGCNDNGYSSGQLGDNTNIVRSSPVQTVAGGSNWKQVSAGEAVLAIREFQDF
jgi:alpha-tubulin suppressor-like RCC1 family protein